ncbi:MAG: hypothetical protein KAH57_04750, partial [Thermoplasmata archaeon]|nr:hypothetical protein [Thermoplasmata archaeon]
PDGRDHFAVGARRDGPSTEGVVSIYPITSLVRPSPTLTITGEYPLQDFGVWIEVWDVTGDGDVELVIGAPSNNSGDGAVYFYDLDYDGLKVTSTLNFSLNAPSGETSFGRFMSTGDINGDSYGDIAIAGDQKVYIYHGGPTADTTADMTLEPKLLEAVNVFTSLEFLGNVLGLTGDTLAVGCPFVGGTSGGLVLLYDGGPSYDSTEDKIVGSSLLNLQNFGLAVDKGDDTDGDGYNEFAISAGGYLTTAGGAGIFSRNNQGNIILVQSFGGQAASNFYGSSLDLGPDIMNDGYDDLFIGSPKYSNSGLVQIMDWYDIATLPDNTPTISVGDTVAWTYSEDKLTGTVTTVDLSGEFNQQLALENVWWKDGYNDYVRISLMITCPTSLSTGGSAKFNLSSFEIEYEYPVTIENIKGPMNSFLGTQTNPEEDGTFHIPFKFTSSTPGGLKVYDLPLGLDLPPEIVSDPQEVFFMDEDTVSDSLLDLWTVFDDDFTLDKELKFIINRKDSNASIVSVLIVDNSSVVVDSLDGEDNDNWTGEVKFTISCVDGIGARVVTEEITVHIQSANDAPGIRAGAFPNTVVVQGKSWEFRNCGYDSEGDPITYDIEGPVNMTIDTSGTINWMATNDYVGMNTYTIILSDGMDERRVNYPLEVINENDRPEWFKIPPSYTNIYFGET